MKKVLSLIIVFSLVVAIFSGCGNGNSSAASVPRGSGGDVYIYNFGDYMSEEALAIFENETGIIVHQDVFEANEEVLPVIESGAKYDIVCISDYCIEKMREKDLLMTLDKSKIPNLKNIDPGTLGVLSVCDPDNATAVPYFTGTIGILYNKDTLDKLGVSYPRKWADLFDPRLKGELLMQSSIRDLYTVGLMKNGFSPNSTNKEEIDKATDDFIAQKPYVQAYMCDQIKDKIMSGEASIAPITSGDVQYVYQEGGTGNYEFIVPEEGTCLFIDAWCILKNAENVENAYKFIDYMCREDVARCNAEYIGYQSVNLTTPDSEFLEMIKRDAYKDYSDKSKNELERDVGDAMRYYTDGFNRLKASEGGVWEE